MGLTHYWQRPTELHAIKFTQAVEDISRILSSLSVPLAGFDGTGRVILKPEMIVLNGEAPAASEPFEIHQVEFDRRGRPQVTGYIKTAGHPYDIAVRISLVVLKHHLGASFLVTSDDREPANWESARKHVMHQLGYGSGFQLDVLPSS